ncbi:MULTISPECIES: ParB/RepB/Spo0J family partition protein [unclassified Polynucleobacter]|uniref:ParB/RepB/Spo0J family partition protein n=1 Tax=unclassified Polynucleobacter TaxID=2640945 RepID=UPI0025739EAB|nr:MULTISPECIES: ParB/RepB/Spo0J family partition protein [unclassified Polynucleobacter]BEI41861.1 ParB/RepB/Spo0J family partition protein [Polynucleobacter sp. HIN10]BEI43638.1 ParB/RepB/Spo0J family partition protein [Polynucleobacter sp. HIN11]
MGVNKKKGLGRGLDALLSASSKAGDADPVADKALQSLVLQRLQAGKYQPRTIMADEPLKELADSIRERGVMQPLLVREIEGGRYEIIAGERRFRAAKLAGLNEVPVRILEVDDQAAAAIALIENMQREDLNPLEESRGLSRLIHEFSFTHEQAAKAVGKSRSAITNLLRLSQLSGAVQAMLLSGDLDMGHARALLSLPGASQVALAQKIVAQGLSVREAERLASSVALAAGDLSRNTPTKGKKKHLISQDQDYKRLAQALADLVGLEAVFKTNKRGGELRFYFSHFDELDSLIKKLGIKDHS